jgi:alpha-beta hydrolase superfamily lysophospholipase
MFAKWNCKTLSIEKMKKNELKLNTSDGIQLTGDRYLPENQPKALVVIVHGMAEHCARYADFSEYLTTHQFGVYTYDQRGHGRTAGSVENLGFFAKKDGWQKVVDDVKLVVEAAKSENPTIPVFVLGHSMGSFISRRFAEQYGNLIAGLILSGTAGGAGLLGKLGIGLTSFIKVYKKGISPSKLLDKMSFGDFNKSFKPNRTLFDWLSRDEKTVDSYIADPFCGTVFTIGFFNDLLKGLEGVNTNAHAQAVRKDLPVYLFSGDKDPVSRNAKQIPIVYEMYKNAGIKDITMKIYRDGRHESLNEINRAEVYADTLNWLNSHLGAGNKSI